MPRKMKTAAADEAALPRIPADFLQKMIPGPVTPAQFEDIFHRLALNSLSRELRLEADTKAAGQ